MDNCEESKAIVKFAALIADSPLAERTTDWAIIGSAAAWLNGIREFGFPDFDILTTKELALETSFYWGMQPNIGTGTPELRSEVYAVCEFDSIVIDLIAEFESFASGTWIPILARKTHTVAIGPVTVNVATIPTLIEIYSTLGRPKDFKKLAILEQHSR